MIQRATPSGGGAATASPPARPDPRDTSPGSRPAQEAADAAIQQLRGIEHQVFESVTALQVENEGLRMQLVERDVDDDHAAALVEENERLRRALADAKDLQAMAKRLLAIIHSMATTPRRASAYPLTGDGRRAQAVLDNGAVFIQQLDAELRWVWMPADPIPTTEAALVQEAERIVASLTQEVAS